MAGSQADFTRIGGLAAVIALIFLAVGTPVRAQVRTPVPAQSNNLLSILEANESITEPLFLDQPLSRPSISQGGGLVPVSPRIQMGLFGTAFDSLFGDVYAEGLWRPLSLSTFFSEGWLQPWAEAPEGRDGLTPRHGWLGSFDGVFYRLWFVAFGYMNNINTRFGGNRYTGTYRIFLPFSRRFEVQLDVPFVVSNGTKDPNRGYTSEFGDLTVIPRFLLSETAATTQVFAVAIRTPTGTPSTANGIMALTPRYEFWTNPAGPWVVRGSSGVFVPMNTAETPDANLDRGWTCSGTVFHATRRRRSATSCSIANRTLPCRSTAALPGSRWRASVRAPDSTSPTTITSWPTGISPYRAIGPTVICSQIALLKVF